MNTWKVKRPSEMTRWERFRYWWWLNMGWHDIFAYLMISLLVLFSLSVIIGYSVVILAILKAAIMYLLTGGL